MTGVQTCALPILNALNIGTGFVGTQTLDGKQSNTNTYRTVTYPVQMLNMYLQVINQVVDICFQFAGTPKVDIGIEQDKRKSNYSTKAELFGADKAIMELFEQKDELIRASAETKANRWLGCIRVKIKFRILMQICLMIMKQICFLI